MNLSRSKLSLALAGALALLASTAHAAPDPAATHRFEQVVHDFYEHYLATHPEEATQLGDHRFDRKSGDSSAAGVAADRRLYRKTLDVIQAIPASSLPPDDAVDREILENDLRARLYDIEVLKTYTWQVTDYSATEGVYVLLARDFAPIKHRLADANLRLQAIPKLVAAAKQNLQRPPRVFTETAIAQNKGAISFLQDDIDDFIKQAPAMEAQLAPARARAIAALKDYGTWLEKTLLPRSDGDFRFGKEHFDQRLKFSLDSDLSADEILRRAEADLLVTQKQMEDTALPLYKRWFPDKPTDGVDGHAIVRAVLDKIAETHPNNDTIVAEARGDLDKATAFVREHKLVTVPDRPIKVIVMPEFQRGAAVAFCDWAGPLDKDGITFYAISPTPADWSPQRVESQYREDNSAELRDITAHEAMPGHYLQGAHASQVHFPTLVRAMTYSGTFVEGWAVYAEQFMAEAGWGGDETRMEQLKVRLRTDTNAIIDQKIHTAGMTEDQAKRLMMETGYQEEGEAAGKWRRAEMSAGQLSTYFVGVQEQLALAHDLQAKMGGDMLAVRDRMLSHGSIATKYVRELEGLPPADTALTAK
ncbi:DUF885 domain-containing protein [Scleromatobacter humisilvae]|uniref:DUF885 domain-containing protein n=1 Tax=Scleromatobacter humisilvae TaxID=2897159 RepID=A0A9X1YM58_9BURK|nr:DUF885 domain-containing protein [Scleromatobacter humisilvae]MCK9688673.1 DUF885 domain-containing protein [Scleromatobacter humisilvae]